MASGRTEGRIGWRRRTNLRTICYNVKFIRDHKVSDYIGGNRVEWVAADVIASFAATVFARRPKKHHGQGYFLSTEIATQVEFVSILSDIHIGGSYHYASNDSGRLWVMHWFFPGVGWVAVCQLWRRVFNWQIRDDILGCSGSVQDAAPFVTGKPSLTLRSWALKNEEALLTQSYDFLY